MKRKATARFNHPHIVHIYGVGMTAGVPYLALEYLEGQTLRERLQQERLSAKESIRIGKAIADALAVAHKKNECRWLKVRGVRVAIFKPLFKYRHSKVGFFAYPPEKVYSRSKSYQNAAQCSSQTRPSWLVVKRGRFNPSHLGFQCIA